MLPILRLQNLLVFQDAPGLPCQKWNQIWIFQTIFDKFFQLGHSSWSKRKVSAALFLQLKQKSETSRMYTLVGTIVDMMRALKNCAVFNLTKWQIVLFEAHWQFFDMNKLVIWDNWKKYWLRNLLENGTNLFKHTKITWHWLSAHSNYVVYSSSLTRISINMIFSSTYPFWKSNDC